MKSRFVPKAEHYIEFCIQWLFERHRRRYGDRRFPLFKDAYYREYLERFAPIFPPLSDWMNCDPHLAVALSGYREPDEERFDVVERDNVYNRNIVFRAIRRNVRYSKSEIVDGVFVSHFGVLHDSSALSVRIDEIDCKARERTCWQNGAPSIGFLLDADKRNYLNGTLPGPLPCYTVSGWDARHWSNDFGALVNSNWRLD